VAPAFQLPPPAIHATTRITAIQQSHDQILAELIALLNSFGGQPSQTLPAFAWININAEPAVYIDVGIVLFKSFFYPGTAEFLWLASAMLIDRYGRNQNQNYVPNHENSKTTVHDIERRYPPIKNFFRSLEHLHKLAHANLLIPQKFGFPISDLDTIEYVQKCFTEAAFFIATLLKLL
jgi:hypothetical protein